MQCDPSNASQNPQEATFTIEMMWDAGEDATAIPAGTVGEGAAFQIGPRGGWQPPHLIALAAASCFMNALLRLADAAGVSILGYVSNSKLRVPTDPRGLPLLTLKPCIVVPSEKDAAKIDELCRMASELAAVSPTLLDRLEVVPETQIIPAAGRRPGT
jgi:organic hydroperoxide reductase OsmC/OhrA